MTAWERSFTPSPGVLSVSLRVDFAVKNALNEILYSVFAEHHVEMTYPHLNLHMYPEDAKKHIDVRDHPAH